MSFLQTFGLGEQKLFDEGKSTSGRVTKTDRCWWLKVNTKAVRFGPNDGAVFPHIIHFTYEVDGTSYTGSRFVNHTLRPPQPGAKITVFYNGQNPSRFAVRF